MRNVVVILFALVGIVMTSISVSNGKSVFKLYNEKSIMCFSVYSYELVYRKSLK